jgi:hypothetical protein
MSNLLIKAVKKKGKGSYIKSMLVFIKVMNSLPVSSSHSTKEEEEEEKKQKSSYIQNHTQIRNRNVLLPLSQNR